MFSFYKTIIIFVLTACFAITSDHHYLHQHGLFIHFEEAAVEVKSGQGPPT